MVWYFIWSQMRCWVLVTKSANVAYIREPEAQFACHMPRTQNAITKVVEGEGGKEINEVLRRWKLRVSTKLHRTLTRRLRHLVAILFPTIQCRMILEDFEVVRTYIFRSTEEGEHVRSNQWRSRLSRDLCIEMTRDYFRIFVSCLEMFPSEILSRRHEQWSQRLSRGFLRAFHDSWSPI